MKLIEKTENQIVFSTEIEDTLANSIRRYVHQILVMAIDELEISKNDSALYDETIAHRVGLIPLKTEKDVAEKSTGKLTLNVNKPGIVYSEELKGNPNPVYGKIPITTLDKNQELSFKATIKTGKGAEHSKFSPGTMFYRNAVELTVDNEFHGEIKKICPKNEIKEKGNKITIKDNLKKEVADVYEGIANKKGKEAERKDEKELIILVESFGQMPAKDIFSKSINVLKKDLTDVAKKMKKA